MPYNPELAIVIPVYNEQSSLEALIQDWKKEFDATGVSYTIVLIDDGSKDDSLKLLTSMQQQDQRLDVHTQPNAGHGPAILNGYRLAICAEWVFQIDSDHQLDTKAFGTLWANRNQFDLGIAERKEKVASKARQCVSKVSALFVRLLAGAGVRDVNSPYRLMRAELLERALERIAADSFAPNVLLTSWFIRKKSRIFTTVAEHRKTGLRPSRMNAYFLRGVLRSSIQTILFRLR